MCSGAGRRLSPSLALVVAMAVALSTMTCEVSGANDLCSIPPATYDAAKSAYPQVAAALSELEKYPIATWYTDRSDDYAAIAKTLVATCPESSRLSIVVQGIPSKDCATIYSSSESTVKTAKDYEKFIEQLAKIVGDRSVLYVLEPGAVELLTSDRCGEDTEYKASLGKAVKLLGANPNAKIYLDVPRRTLESNELTKEVVEIVRSLATDAGNVNGIALNTGDYGANTEIARLCTVFQVALGSTELHCVIDTSRNFAHLSANERCNPVSAGIGFPPSADTGFDNIDYLMWTKPPGESDGKCDESSRSTNSVQGPPAGLFFEFGFKVLWNQGYLVQKLGQASISMSPAAAAITTLGTCASMSRRAFALVQAALVVLAATSPRDIGVAAELCSLVPVSYTGAKSTHPETAAAISELEKHSIATWYSDRNGDYTATLKELVAKCDKSDTARLSIVVYGLPNKDCEAGYSSGGGTVKNAADYLTFIKTLKTTVGNRNALYVLEPDAVGLLAKAGGCGEAAGYRENLKTAIAELSTNPNAEIYLDIGYWTLMSPDSLARVVTVIKGLASTTGSSKNNLKGITLNTSNYRSNAQMSGLCTSFQTAMGSDKYSCIIDTSRNYNEPASTEWCNVKGAGIGNPPTDDTGLANIDYFMWVKVPGESDGKCDDGTHTADSLKGPDAGKFFAENFKLLWNQGYFVETKGQAAIGGAGGGAPTPAPTTMAPSTPEPSSESPIQQFPMPEPTTSSPIAEVPEAPTPTAWTLPPSTPCPSTASPSTSPPDIPTPAPTTLSLGSGTFKAPTDVPTPAPTAPTPEPTPCVYHVAGGDDANQQATPLPSQPALTPPPTPTTAASPATLGPAPMPSRSSSDASRSGSGSESAGSVSSSDDVAVDDADAVRLPTPAPTSLLRGDSEAIDVGNDSPDSGNVKQVSTESTRGSSGADAGILVVLFAVAAVVAIAAFMTSRAKKQQLAEPKESPHLTPLPEATSRAFDARVSYLSVL
ncbi:hypothetical protein PybrP1_010996 [[Pythium] brassicae (nom. inval.)]|nr:hypothetical protein PybrP1_010996 [[Pythium] brassicae (nom. inval.)]